MRLTFLAIVCLAMSISAAELQTGPPLPHKPVKDWAQLPAGWNFGETSGVDVDKNDNVWVFNRGKHPVIQFDKNGKMLQAWNDMQIVSSHGIRVDPDGNIWTVDVKGHTVFKWTPQGKLLMVVGRGAGNNETKDQFNEPTGVAFGKNGEWFFSDGYVNSRVVKFNRDGEYLLHWGSKGTGDGEFNLVHDVALDGKGKVFVADRNNQRIQIFDENGKFLSKWTGIGAPWGITYVARENAIYMCDGVNNRISRLNMEGQVTGVLSSYGRVPGKVDFAHNIAVDSTGAIYVAEIKNWRVQKFAK
ncbi:MAG TPA: peptidyl-alpha-hydroxyglycine alpha-amidating lyase family protein [Bryobacteraceae bacterium]|nr:peptidyl-alpha-hydroxyglycine alpha-amidating lyase family protein [Bryobacteraceae bacterium]